MASKKPVVVSDSKLPVAVPLVSSEYVAKVRSVRPFAKFFYSSERSAKQKFKEMCDVNHIINVFNKTGQLINSRAGVPLPSMDFRKVPDFHAMQNLRVRISGYFDSMAPDVRAKFKSADAFFTFCSDPRNSDAVVSMGLKDAPIPPPLEKVVKVEVVSPAVKPPGHTAG